MEAKRCQNENTYTTLLLRNCVQCCETAIESFKNAYIFKTIQILEVKILFQRKQAFKYALNYLTMPSGSNCSSDYILKYVLS